MTTTVQSLAPEHPIIEMVNVGHFSTVDAHAAGRTGLTLSRQTGIWNVLMDMSHTTSTPSARDIVAFIEQMAEFELPPEFRQAVVRPTDVVAATWVDLYVKASANRGRAAALFRTREEAIAWLCSDPDEAAQPPQ